MGDRELVLGYLQSVKKELDYVLDKLNAAEPGIDPMNLHELIGSARAFASNANELLVNLMNELSTPE